MNNIKKLNNVTDPLMYECVCIYMYVYICYINIFKSIGSGDT